MGSWYANGIALSTLAKNIQNRSAGWSTAPRRGTNPSVPGQPGSVFVQKPEDNNILNLDMWVRGYNDDGSAPGSSGRERLMVDNLDDLMRIFCGGQLVELVRAEDGVDYGRQNLLPNPSAEKSGGKQVVRENQIQNPSGEYSSDTVVARRNFSPNPGMEDAAREATFRTNYVKSPRFIAEGLVTVRRSNLVLNPSGESALKPWRALNANSKVSRERFRAPTIGWPTQGKWSLKVTALAGANVGVAGAAFRVTAGTTYAAQALVYNTGATRTGRIALTWRNRAGAVISTTNIDVSAGGGLITLISGTAAAPALSWTCTPKLVTVSAANGEVQYWDLVMVEAAGSVGTYFDGDTDEVDTLRHRWQDDPGNSPSDEYTVMPWGWKTTDGQAGRQFGITTEQAKFGPMSGRVLITTLTGVRAILIRQQPKRACPVEPNTIISSRISVQLAHTVSATRTVVASLVCYDSDGNSLGAAYNAGTTVAMTDVSVGLDPGSWVDVLIENVQVRPKTATTSIELFTGEAWSVGDFAYFQGAVLEEGAAAGTFFDGNTRDDDTWTFDWDNDPHQSISYQVGFKVASWKAVDGTQYQSGADSRTGDYFLRVEPVRSPASTLRPGAYATALDIREARSHSLSIYVRPSRTCLMRTMRSVDGGTTWTYGTSTSCTGGVWTRLSTAAIAIVAGQDESLVLFGAVLNEAPVDGDFYDFEDALFEPTSDVRAYFDGNSGKRYDWLDEEFSSVSLWKPDKADGWAAYGAGRPSVYRDKSGATDGSYTVLATSSQDGDFGVTFAQDGVDDKSSYAFGIDATSIGAGATVRAGIDQFNRNGDLITSTSTDTVLVADTVTRVSHTIASLSANTVAVAPWVVRRSATAGMQLRLDKAIFGFGGTTTYADGNSGGGWEWVGIKNASESQQIDTVPNNWEQSGGTLQQSGAWTTDRLQSALWTCVTTTAPGKIWMTKGGKKDKRRFRILSGRQVVFAADFRGVTATRVRLTLVPYKWNGWGWETTTSSSIVGSQTDIALNVTSRLSVTGTFTGDATHFLPIVEVYANGGGNPTASEKVGIDSAILSFQSPTNTSYIDGEDAWVRWKGDTDDSVSETVGPARRIMVETISAITPNSFNGDLSRFSLELVAPQVYWEDTLNKIDTYVIGRPGSEISLTHLDKGSAPINDSRITLYGPFNDLTITDLESGSWITIDDRIQDDQGLIIDSEKWTVTNLRGKSVIDDITHSGSAFLLPLTPVSDETLPRLRFDAKSIGRGAKVKISARRRFRIA